MTFKLTDKQLEAQKHLASNATHCMLFGGSRSGKTFLLIRNIVFRALKAPCSRHCILRFRFNHVKSSVVFDTFPKVMELCFSQVNWVLNKTDWNVKILPNTNATSEIWFGGLDDKERTEKILGNEYATIYLNECSQISWESRNLAVTRLAQLCKTYIKNREDGILKPRMYYDCNPPSKSHWTYKVFVKKQEPVSKKTLDQENFILFKMNPQDNIENLSNGYLEVLKGLPCSLQKRFLLGDFAEENPNALFLSETIDKWRVIDKELPDLLRIGIGVDPSGAGDKNNENNDAIGIIVAGLGNDGICYVLEDCTIKASPSVWGNVIATTFDRYGADFVAGETNYGGEMVNHVVQTARPNTPFLRKTATRGKVVRAEPFSVLYENGKVRHVGFLKNLEEELEAFSSMGYLGENSPNRADALIWLLTVFFPNIINQATKLENTKPTQIKSSFNRKR